MWRNFVSGCVSAFFLVFEKNQFEIFITRANCIFWEMYADSATRTLPLFFFRSFIFFDRSAKILTCLKICLWKSGIYRHKIVRLFTAQFGLVEFDFCSKFKLIR